MCFINAYMVDLRSPIGVEDKLRGDDKRKSRDKKFDTGYFLLYNIVLA